MSITGPLQSDSTSNELWQFLAISHDLKAPARSIRCYAELLDRQIHDSLDADQRRLLASIIQTAERMQNLIDDALLFGLAGDETGRSRVDAEEVLRFAISNLNTAVSESNAIITHDQLPAVTANFGTLAKLFQNLLENAIEYRNGKRPRIHVGCSRRRAEWIFSVADNGIGIAPQYHEDIFLPLKRLHSNQEHPGTGLGLAICRRIIDSYSGRIWVQSAPGKGSVFYFTIPDVQQRAARRDAAAEMETCEVAGARAGR